MTWPFPPATSTVTVPSGLTTVVMPLDEEQRLDADAMAIGIGGGLAAGAHRGDGAGEPENGQCMEVAFHGDSRG